jgi:hypothetical protein
MTDETSTRKPDDVTATQYNVPRVCIACHAKRFGKFIHPADCLGFAACEDCTKVENGKEVRDDKSTCPY